ncbi:hypothetical protein HMPREF1544_09498 [Mucor circinelloides 1006PhL]|uniref:ATP synthase regulation protein NCA2 n=1 Tax=Mucor circinelloides f. circinelloides (strain 1006PhL) TaxID=1220926 RepID=S2J686_MUCC1|nr:hypothetical protein HMPREF1544_09498 [Mucor circinelloides 1006PhL]
MSTFVNEQVKRLNTSLTQSFEKHLANTASLSSLNEKDKFLLETSQALDLTSASLPSFEKVQEYLEKYSEFKAKGDISATSEAAADPALEWLFVAKCTIAVYGQVFSKVLNLTLPISESIDYWNSIQGSTINELYYAMQIAPSRIYSLLKNTAKQISNTSSAVDQVRSLFTSSDYVLSQLFPIHNSSGGVHSVKTKAAKQSLTSFNAFKFFNLSSYHHRPLILEIISNEVHLKKKSLQQFRSEQAASLGVLLLTPFQFDSQDDFASATAKETKNCIEVIKYVMGSSSQDSQQTEKNTHHLQQRLSTMDLRGASATDATAELYKVAKQWSCTYNNRLQCIQSSYGTPSAITRYWIPALGSYFVGGLALRYGFQRKEDIMHWVEEAGKTAHDFILNWIWEPVVKVYGTIRLKDQRLSLLSKEGLQSDLDAISGAHAIDVREGDISVLLKEYEKEIKNPLRNAITGDLLQTIFIQVQKTKVDVDLAMSALDKLLKSNELNFAFLAVAPSMLLTWASASWFRNTIQGRSQQRMKKTGLPMKETLRRIERQLIVMEPIHKEKGELNEWSSGNQHQIECETQGILLCEVHLLRAYARSLPLQNSTRARFLEDIRDLENPSLTNEQKIQTIARMTRFWKFLS